MHKKHVTLCMRNYIFSVSQSCAANSIWSCLLAKRKNNVLLLFNLEIIERMHNKSELNFKLNQIELLLFWSLVNNMRNCH